MNIAAILMIAGACSGAIGAVHWFRISQAPGWRSTRPFAWVSLTAGGYCLADTVLVLDAPDRMYVLSQHVSMAFAAAHAITWLFWFAGMDQRRPLHAWEKVVAGTAVLLMVACLVPGTIVTHEIHEYQVGWLGVTYHLPRPTIIGFVAMLFFIGTMWAVAVSAHRRWRDGWRARYPLYSVSVLSLLSVLDTISTAGYATLPLMTDLGFFLMITGFGLLYLGRFIQDAEELERLSAQLELDVEGRTRELTEAQGALARSEMLAAVGRLAAGVAHEINNPAAVVLANLTYLSGEIDESLRLPADGRQALEDATDSTMRIARIVKQLVDATQGVATHDIELTDVPVGIVMANAVSSLRGAAAVEIDVEPTELVARADATLLAQVLVQLVANAAEAARERHGRAGKVWLAAAAREDRVELQVRDNGGGISDDHRQRLFELFNSSRLARKGAGLGLAVASGLTKAQGGSLRLVDTSPAGTTFAVVLPASGARAVDTREFRSPILDTSRLLVSRAERPPVAVAGR